VPGAVMERALAAIGPVTSLVLPARRAAERLQIPNLGSFRPSVVEPAIFAAFVTSSGLSLSHCALPHSHKTAT
jgi:hypothetical protein